MLFDPIVRSRYMDGVQRHRQHMSRLKSAVEQRAQLLPGEIKVQGQYHMKKRYERFGARYYTIRIDPIGSC